MSSITLVMYSALIAAGNAQITLPPSTVLYLPDFQNLKLEGVGTCTTIEDCYGYNVKVYGCDAGKCTFMTSTATSCQNDVNCTTLSHTTCKESYCMCDEGYGIHKFVIDLCAPIPVPTERWKYESRRDPEKIAAVKPWGEGKEYGVFKQHKAIILFGLLGFGAGFVLYIVVSILCILFCASEPPPSSEADKAKSVTGAPSVAGRAKSGTRAPSEVGRVQSRTGALSEAGKVKSGTRARSEAGKSGTGAPAEADKVKSETEVAAEADRVKSDTGAPDEAVPITPEQNPDQPEDTGHGQAVTSVPTLQSDEAEKKSLQD